MSERSASVGGAAGAAGINHLFQQALTELDVDRRARDAGVKDQPPPHSISADANERQFISYFSNQLRARKGQCEKALSEFSLDRTATSSKIDIGQTRASLASLFNSIKPDLARLVQDHQQDLERARSEEAHALRYLRHFQIENQLQNRAADPAPTQVRHFTLVALLAVLEWVSLSIFYAEGSDFGLLGGVLMAMALSIINIVLAVFVGAILRYLNHRSMVRKALAVLGSAMMIGLFLFATGFAAHYRNAVREISISHSPLVHQSLSQSGQSSSIVTSPATPIDDDQWKASKLAWNHFSEQGFIVSDVLSWLLVILAILFGIVAAWKGYGIDDRYPGYGPISRRYKELSAAYEAARKRYTQAGDQLFTVAGEKQQSLLREVRKHIEYFQESASKSEIEASSFAEFAREVEQACNDIVFRYREINRQVATSSAPSYFAEPVSFDRVLMTSPESLSAMDRSRLKEYTDAIHEFTNAVQRDDAYRQGMRAQHLSTLTEFFESIERAINDKLNREAQLYKG